MPYFPGGGGVAYQAPHVFYRQPARGTRGRLGQSLSDILGIVSDVAGTVSDDTSSPSSYYAAPPAPAPAPATGISSTTLLLGAAVVGGLIYFGTKK